MTDTASATRRGMRPDDLFRIRWLSDAQIQPGGQGVAFVVTTLSEADDEYRSSIWLAPVEGGEARPFTRGTRRDTAPRWSPDGQQLAFLSDRDGEKPQLYVMPASGGEARKLTKFKLGTADPPWSPDGRSICVVVKEATVDELEPEEGTKRAPPPRIITS